MKWRIRRGRRRHPVVRRGADSVVGGGVDPVVGGGVKLVGSVEPVVGEVGGPVVGGGVIPSSEEALVFLCE